MPRRSRTTPKSRWYEEMHRAHQDFRRSSAALLQTLRSCRSTPGADLRDCLRVEFDSFARLLRRHFAQEECAELFRPDCASTPAGRRWAESTLEAHRAFESRLDELGRMLHGGPPEAAFEEGLLSLIDDLFEHELSEERLVQRLVFEESEGLDIGL